MSEDNLKETFAYLEQRAKELERYSDKLRENVKLINDEIEAIAKQAGITYISDIAIEENEDYPCRWVLAIMKQKDFWGIVVLGTIDKDDHMFSCWIENASRLRIKNFVKQAKRFFEGYKAKLDETTEEYRKVSEITEKLVKEIE